MRKALDQHLFLQRTFVTKHKELASITISACPPLSLRPLLWVHLIYHPELPIHHAEPFEVLQSDKLSLSWALAGIHLWCSFCHHCPRSAVCLLTFVFTFSGLSIDVTFWGGFSDALRLVWIKVLGCSTVPNNDWNESCYPEDCNVVCLPNCTLTLCKWCAFFLNVN